MSLGAQLYPERDLWSKPTIGFSIRHDEAEVNRRHWHVWLYERDADDQINVLRRQPETYDKRGRLTSTKSHRQ